MILSEGEVALFARLADEAFDVFEPPDAGLESLLTSGVDGGGRVLLRRSLLRVWRQRTNSASQLLVPTNRK